MEKEKSITVCGTWMSLFGSEVPKEATAQMRTGILEYPLLFMLKGNIVFHPTAMIRKDFLRTHRLRYENYDCAEDYKLWLEIAQKGGVFYVDSQMLLFYRVSEQQVSRQKKDMAEQSGIKIKQRVLDYLVEKNSLQYPSIKKMSQAFSYAQNDRIMTLDDTFDFFYTLFLKNKNNISAL